MTYEAISSLSVLSVPPSLLGDNEPMLRGDQHRLWLRWFLEGMASPEALARSEKGEIDIFRSVFKRLSTLYADVDAPRRQALADILAKLLHSDVERLRTGTPRDQASQATRKALIESSPICRCYLCGYAFSREALDAFAGVKGRDPVVLPLLIDVLRPRGLATREIGIEIEHVVPVAAGGSGQDNLRIACGWCNMHKSSRTSVYEASFMPPQTAAFDVGPHSLCELPHRSGRSGCLRSRAGVITSTAARDRRPHRIVRRPARLGGLAEPDQPRGLLRGA